MNDNFHHHSLYDQLLDGASGFGTAISKETIELSEFVRDPGHSLTDRLESYSDIINIEVGDTSLTRARNIERESGLRQVYLKFEGGNPTGTQKDRIAFAQCHDALRREYNTITLATCGNYGAAIALASNLCGLKCIVCIPEQYHTQRIKDIEKSGAKIIRIKGTYEEAVTYSKDLAIQNELYDANPGGANTTLQLFAYGEIAFEIYDILRDAPKILAAPVSNGTMLAGIYRGFVSLYKRGKTSRVPIMIAGSSFKKNPIIQSFKKGLNSCEDLAPEKIRESKVNEPLINWHSLDGDEALYAIRQSKGLAADVSDSKLIHYSKILKEKEGLNVLPASTAGLVALLEYHNKMSLEGDRYVAVLTGRK
ncbi:pyridoxal-phosphate dependent enzyme [candidate division KSB1 bacterium]